MTRHFACHQPTEMPFDILLAILLLGAAGYFGALTLTWLTA
jgi:hypothetical protein